MTPLPVDDGREKEALAPVWHTALLIALIVAVAVAGTWMSHRGTAVARPPAEGWSRITMVYLPMIVVEWGLVFYVCRVARSRNALPGLIGRRWTTPRRVLVDLAVAAAAFVLIEATEVLCARYFGMRQSVAVRLILPAAGTERLAWALVAVSAGFCEEVVYRGYLQRQLAALTRSGVTATVLQAVLFGMAHGEQGVAAATRMALYGFALGALATRRGTLLPGIICHTGIDLASGLLGR